MTTNFRYHRCGACNINWPISDYYKRCRQCDVPTAVCSTLDPRNVLSEKDARRLIETLNREGLIKDKKANKAIRGSNVEEFDKITKQLFGEAELEKFRRLCEAFEG